MTSPVNSKPEEKNGKAEDNKAEEKNEKVEEKNEKVEEKQQNGKKSPSHSANGIKSAPSRTEGGAEAADQPNPFSWFRVFKLADLMIKQGC